ncbi:unnamed protein product [Dibothriocephalus latus]|uniref:TRPM SLOG domain-containing protein n=1 Tax=Dibothriocephalus latus TaxID=60516 RepID=A0A3P7LCT7_DIBLA|nr:unnamed protein product [Dibothriocephalus latus]
MGCWVIGDGLDRGIGKIAGEAVSEYIEAYGGDRTLAVSVTPMNVLKHRELFYSRMSLVQYPSEAEEDEEDEDEENEEQQAGTGVPDSDSAQSRSRRLEPQNILLDKSYNYLILLASGSVTPSDPQYYQNDLIRTRVTLERTIAVWRPVSAFLLAFLLQLF